MTNIVNAEVGQEAILPLFQQGIVQPAVQLAGDDITTAVMSLVMSDATD